MSKFIIIALLITVTIAVSAADLDCSGVVKKETEGVLNWLGNITITVPVDTDETAGWSFSMIFDQPFNFMAVWEGLGYLNGTAKWAEITNKGPEDAKLNKEDIKSLLYRISYGRFIPQPKVISLRFQDIEMCK